MIKRAGLEVLVVERAERIAASWRARYDGFRLNTSSWFSHLPGQRLPRHAGRWPSRDDLVAYYEDYAAEHALQFALGTTVERIVGPGRDGWRVSAQAEEFTARVVVVATGKYRTPVIPPWPGRETYRGQLLHSADYRNAEPIAIAM